MLSTTLVACIEVLRLRKPYYFLYSVPFVLPVVFCKSPIHKQFISILQIAGIDSVNCICHFMAIFKSMSMPVHAHSICLLSAHSRNFKAWMFMSEFKFCIKRAVVYLMSKQCNEPPTFLCNQQEQFRVAGWRGISQIL